MSFGLFCTDPLFLLFAPFVHLFCFVQTINSRHLLYFVQTVYSRHLFCADRLFTSFILCRAFIHIIYFVQSIYSRHLFCADHLFYFEQTIYSRHSLYFVQTIYSCSRCNTNVGTLEKFREQKPLNSSTTTACLFKTLHREGTERNKCRKQ